MPSLFNIFFTSIGITLANAIKQKCTQSQSPGIFKFQGIHVTSVLKNLSNLKTNKSTGLDRITARLLKDAAAVIAPSLTQILNLSLSSSTFPKIWKNGTPIFKSGERSNMSITVLPTLSKILERFVQTQIYNYLTENKILTSNQFGFRPKLSTSTAFGFLYRQHS
jgi:hypothetical protein